MAMNPRGRRDRERVHRLDDQFRESEAAAPYCSDKINPLSALGWAPPGQKKLQYINAVPALAKQSPRPRRNLVRMPAFHPAKRHHLASPMSPNGMDRLLPSWASL